MPSLSRCAAVASSTLVLVVLGAAPAAAHAGEAEGGGGILHGLATLGIGVAALGTVTWATWREKRRSR